LTVGQYDLLFQLHGGCLHLGLKIGQQKGALGIDSLLRLSVKRRKGQWTGLWYSMERDLLVVMHRISAHWPAFQPICCLSKHSERFFSIQFEAPNFAFRVFFNLTFEVSKFLK
jgi:hypothetical protein